MADKKEKSSFDFEKLMLQAVRLGRKMNTPGKFIDFVTGELVEEVLKSPKKITELFENADKSMRYFMGHMV